MNLRTLKKLSKRAAPLLPLLGDTREQFFAEPWENYTKAWISDRKHWKRNATVWKDLEKRSKGRFCYRARSGRVIVVSNHYIHPRKRTIMVGSMCGYYEPEWEEETAWDSLESIVRGAFFEYDHESGDCWPTRVLDTPTQIFAAAQDLIAARRHTHIKVRESIS